MDTTPDLKRPRKKSEPGSEKQSPGRLVPQTVELNGKVYELPPDFDELEEIDYEDPTVQRWLAEIEAENIRVNGKMTSEEANYVFSRIEELEKEFPQKSARERTQVALSELRSGRAKVIVTK